MSSVGKANRFMQLARDNGWDEPKYVYQPKDDFVEVTCTRKGEELIIGWVADQLNEPPRYKLHGVEARLHSAAVARKHITAIKPDLELYQRRSKAAATKANAQAAAGETSTVAQHLEVGLPFDIETDPDSIILKAIRGNSIVWRNRLTGEIETEHVPHTIRDKGSVRVFNYDLENVFYLATANSGKDYLSFMDMQGRFRAVHLDALVGVV